MMIMEDDIEDDIEDFENINLCQDVCMY